VVLDGHYSAQLLETQILDLDVDVGQQTGLPHAEALVELLLHVLHGGVEVVYEFEAVVEVEIAG
jgi:hypothetical protein